MQNNEKQRRLLARLETTTKNINLFHKFNMNIKNLSFLIGFQQPSTGGIDQTRATTSDSEFQFSLK